MNMVWLRVCKISWPDLQLPPPGQAQLSPLLSVALGEPLARLHELDDVDELFSGHDGEGDGSENPWDGRVHFVCSVLSNTQSVSDRIGNIVYRIMFRSDGDS